MESDNSEQLEDAESAQNSSNEIESTLASTSTSKKQQKSTKNEPKKETSPGILFLSTIPYFMTVKSVRRYFLRYGPIDRIFLQVESRVGASGKKERHYTEGWVEFKDKNLAKRIAATLNNTTVGGKRRSKSYECLWNIKYLSGFKWVHLSEQLEYEKAVHQQKLRAEISQAKREANFFAEQIEKGENLRKLEKQVLKKGGLWNQYQRQLKQKKVLAEKKPGKRARQDDPQGGGLLGMIFDKGPGSKNKKTA